MISILITLNFSLKIYWNHQQIKLGSPLQANAKSLIYKRDKSDPSIESSGSNVIKIRYTIICTNCDLFDR